MTPLERPICCLCDEPAVLCGCPDLHSGQEIAIPLVYKTEPTTQLEGLDLFATYIERHPATRVVDVRRFIGDYAKELKAVDQIKSELLPLALRYAERDFPPMGSDDVSDKPGTAKSAVALFLSCRWSKMTNFDMSIIRNAIRMRYPQDASPPLGIRHIYSTLELALGFLGRISRRRAFSLELYPPIFRNSHEQNVYTLTKPPAKASYNGLSLSAYEKLMDVMMRDDQFSEASALSLLAVSRTKMEDIVALIQARRASDIYVFHDPENPLKPLTAKSVKRQIAKALAKMDVHVELYEVQSLLDATIARVRVDEDKYKTQEGRRCEVCKKPASLKCAKRKEVSYCSKNCQRLDWNGGHKQVCGV